MKLVLPLRNQQVELPLLWRLTSSLGGSDAVTQLALWPTIAEQLLSISPNNTVRSCLLVIKLDAHGHSGSTASAHSISAYAHFTTAELVPPL